MEKEKNVVHQYVRGGTKDNMLLPPVKKIVLEYV